ncbi:Phosphate regulon sensor protein PhoR (SphS) [Salinispira pacifica]|uniref:histidine kinase n=2 Tax=Salinispira pacifica TaxID=1307761 RepID=V5WEU9_9SPIO|nr:Phosphate regulon sensor protein PhoR (SphS) [Salinispira pacifica]
MLDTTLKKRLLPLLFAVHLLAAFILISSISVQIQVKIQQEIEEVLHHHISVSGRLFSLLGSMEMQQLKSNPDNVTNSLAPRINPVDIRSGSGHSSSLTRFYFLKDLLSSDNYLRNLEEIREAVRGEDGFSSRDSEDPRFHVYGAARIISGGGDDILAHSVVSQNYISQLTAYSAVVISFTLLFQLAALVVFSLRVLNTVNKPLTLIQDSIEDYAAGRLDRKLRIRSDSGLEKMGEALNRMSSNLNKRISVLRNQREELESILSNMQEGVLVIHHGERILMINQTFLDMFGIHKTAETCQGYRITDIFRSSDLNSAVEALEHGRKNLTRKIRSYDPDGSGFRSLYMNGVFVDPPETPGGRILIVLHDISEITRLEKIRRDFVSNVSHELKTPITSIQGFSETLLSGTREPQEVERFMAIILRQSRRMEHIVTDLLTLSKIEQQEATIHMQDCNIAGLMKECLELVEDEARNREVNLRLEMPDLPMLMLNPFLVEQAVVNLLENAVKYNTPGGEVLLEVQLNPAQPAEPETLNIAVQDNGPGIPKRDLPRLFERFYRVDRARSRSLGGTGLGLAIVKHIAQVHGGSVSVESEVGKGSRFSISLPYRRESDT